MLKYKFDFYPTQLKGGFASCKVTIETTDKDEFTLNNALIRDGKYGPWLALPNFKVQGKDGKDFYVPYVTFTKEDKKEMNDQAVAAYEKSNLYSKGAPKEQKEQSPASTGRQPRSDDISLDDDVPF